MPPELFDTLAACPPTKVWKTKGRSPRAGPGRAAGHRAAAGRVRGRAAPQRVVVVDAEQPHGALAVAVLGPGRARTRARLGGSRAAWRRVAGRAGQSRTTNTGQLAWWTHRSQTDPSVKLPCPRAPTTSRLAFSANFDQHPGGIALHQLTPDLGGALVAEHLGQRLVQAVFAGR